MLLRGDEALGYRIAPAPGAATPPNFLGVGSCDIARIWGLEVDGRAVTIIGGTADPDGHEDAMANIDELFGVMSFDSDGG